MVSRVVCALTLGVEGEGGKGKGNDTIDKGSDKGSDKESSCGVFPFPCGARLHCSSLPSPTNPQKCNVQRSSTKHSGSC